MSAAFAVVLAAIALAHSRGSSAPRGRVFIESPVVQNGTGVLDSLASAIFRDVTAAVGRSRAAHVVPADSVVAIEAAAIKGGGWNSPRRTLANANASIGVMTVLSMHGDSVRVSATFERLLPPRAPAAASLETSPLISFSESAEGRSHIPFRLATAIVGALDQMRSCDAAKHMAERSVPWCWRRENEPGIVKDYFRMRRERAAQLSAVPSP